MNVFLNNQENEIYQYSNFHLQNYENSFHKSQASLSQQNIDTSNNFNHFVDIASNFWTKKFDEKAKELQSETLSEIFSPSTLSQVEVFDFAGINTGSHPQINQEISTDLSADKFIDNFKWDSSLDEILLELAFQSKCDWAAIAKKFPESRISPKILKDRYRDLFNVTLANKQRFTADEDRRIIKYFQKYGTNWRAISNMLPGRAPTTIKNRFYSSLRNKVQRYSSDKTPITSSKAIRPIFSDLPTLRRGSFEDLSFNIQEQSLLKVNFIPQVKQNVEQFYDCDKFFAFENNNSYEAKTCEMTEEPYDLEYQNFTVPVNVNQPRVFDFQQPSSNEVQNNINTQHLQSNQQGTIQTETYNWTQQVDNTPEVIFEENANLPTKDPKKMVSELNNRVNVVMSLCFQIQQEIEKTMQRANSTPSVVN
jgi:hypothetical protein